ncbi:MAG: hypothetical protein ACP5N0_12800 [Methanosarcina sp.]
MPIRPSNRPSKSESWSKQHGRLTLHLKPSDRILFRSVNEKCFPAGVGTGKAGKYCTVTIGHKKIEGIQKIKEFRDLEEYQGLILEILPEDEVYTCLINSKGVPSSVGAGKAGKDVTIIIHESET